MNIDTTIREILIDELSRRRARNPQYTMNKFASDLKLSATQMSGIIRGERGISPQSAKLISKKFKWSKIDKIIFSEIAKFQFSRSEVDRNLAKKKLLRLFKKKDTKSFSISGLWNATERIGSTGRQPLFWNPKTDSHLLIFDQQTSYKYVRTSAPFCLTIVGNYQLSNGILTTSDDQYLKFGTCPWEGFDVKMGPFHEFSWLDEDRFMLKTEANLFTPDTLLSGEIFITVWMRQKEI